MASQVSIRLGSGGPATAPVPPWRRGEPAMAKPTISAPPFKSSRRESAAEFERSSPGRSWRPSADRAGGNLDRLHDPRIAAAAAQMAVHCGALSAAPAASATSGSSGAASGRKLREDLFVERGVGLPRLRCHHAPVAYRLLIHKAGRRPAPHPHAHAGSKSRAPDRLPPKFVLRDKSRRSISPGGQTHELRRAAWHCCADTPALCRPSKQHRRIFVHANILERHGGVEAVAGPLDVGVPSRLKIVYDQIGSRRRDGAATTGVQPSSSKRCSAYSASYESHHHRR